MNDKLKLRILQIWEHVPHVYLWHKERTLLELCVEKHCNDAYEKLFQCPDSEVGFLMIQAGKKNFPRITHFIKNER